MIDNIFDHGAEETGMTVADTQREMAESRQRFAEGFRDERGRCPVCHRDIRIRADGTLRNHGDLAHTGDRRTARCAGVGQSPITVTDTSDEVGVGWAAYRSDYGVSERAVSEAHRAFRAGWEAAAKGSEPEDPALAAIDGVVEDAAEPWFARYERAAENGATMQAWPPTRIELEENGLLPPVSDTLAERQAERLREQTSQFAATRRRLDDHPGIAYS